MLCDTDRWHVSYYFLCDWLSLSHGRWLEYSFHFDNSADYPQQSQSCTLRDLYVKIPVSYQPQQQSGKTSVPEDLPSLSKFIYANIITAVSISSAYKAAVFPLRVVQECKAEERKTLHERTFSFSRCYKHVWFSTNHVSHLCPLRYLQQLCPLVSNFYKGCTEKAFKPRGQRPMCWWIMGFHCACCCWQALLVGRMSL